MTVTRRFLLKLFAALGVMLAQRISLAEQIERNSRVASLRALGPLVDTLLPEDTTPSATQLGVDRALIDQALADPKLAGLLIGGCAWLDKAARERGAEEFAGLDQTAREAVLTAAEQSPKRSLPEAFFGVIRHHAFRHYYAKPASWRGLGFAGPPQHRGFPDHAKSPQAPAS
jgi:hypothetical protein